MRLSMFFGVLAPARGSGRKHLVLLLEGEESCNLVGEGQPQPDRPAGAGVKPALELARAESVDEVDLPLASDLGRLVDGHVAV